MIKLSVVNTTLNAGQTIPLTTDNISDIRFSLNNNIVYIKSPGKVELIGNINATATAAGAISINVVENGNVVATYSTVAAAVGDVITIPVYDLFRVLPAPLLTNYANLSLTVTNNVTVSSGEVTLKYIR